MVGFSDTATVTFVPFFAVPPTTPSADERVVPDTDRVTALRVAHALAALEVPILRTLEVSVHDGHVTLRGRVRNYYERQLAHAHAKRTAGVKRVTAQISIADNRL